MKKLSKSMSVSEFESNYYYAKELKAFAASIGIKVGNWRKHEIEELIKDYLVTKKVPTQSPTLPRKAGEMRDTLGARVQVKNYVGDKKTKEFLLQEVYRESPKIKSKSGQWYWLNDWRRTMQESQQSFTYGDLANRLRELMSTEGRLPQIPSARMNNFISDFLEAESENGLTRADAMQAWSEIREMPGPKTYAAYRKMKSS